MKNIMPWISEHRTVLLWWLLPLAIFMFMYGAMLNFPLNDPDIWWHLKTGEYIVTHWEVPSVDPFAYTTVVPMDHDKLLGMRSQWLGQVIFYEVFRFFGLPGLGMFRNLLVLMPMLIVYLWLISRGVGHLRASAVTFFPLYIYGYQIFYSFERPQGLSFGLIALVLVLIERVREKSLKPGMDFSYWLLPLAMALWANIHGGYVIGVAVIGIYLGSEFAVELYRKVRKKINFQRGRAFYAAGIGSIAATMLTPNGPYLFLSYMFGGIDMLQRDLAKVTSGMVGGQSAASGQWVENIVLEFRPLSFFYHDLGYTWLRYYWAMVVIAIALMLLKFILRRRVELAQLLVFSLIAFMAEQHARILMFALAVVPFYIGKDLSEIKDLPGKLWVSLRLGAYASMVILAVGFMTYMKEAGISLKPNFKATDQWISPWYPFDLAQFIEQNKIPGPMYNYYTWGGFLIWSLYPDYRVFIDGRALDDLVNRTADSILKTAPGWDQQLDVYGINFVAIPVIYRESGHIIQLAPALAENPNWKLIFLGNNSALFIRDVPMNKDLIDKYSIDKNAVFTEIIDLENMFLRGNPTSPVYNFAKADSLFLLGKYDEAKAIYSRFPDLAAPALQRLKEMGH